MESKKRECSLLVFCPMPVERAAFYAAFGLDKSNLAWLENPLGLPIFSGVLSSLSGRTVDFIIAASQDKGPSAARNAVARTLDFVTPWMIAILGIAGGLAEDLDYGDVVVASELIPYEYRKERDDATELIPQTNISVSQVGLNLFSGLEFSPPSILRPDGSNAKYVCRPIASGDTVVRSDLGDVKTYLRGHTLRPAVTEMEAAAIGHELASRGDEYVSRSIVVRGISDLADPNKNDSFHDLAASNASTVFRAMLDRFPPAFEGSLPDTKDAIGNAQDESMAEKGGGVSVSADHGSFAAYRVDRIGDISIGEPRKKRDAGETD